MKENGRPEPTLAFNRTLQRSILHAQGSSRAQVNGCDILIHMYSEPDSQAVYLLEKQGIEKLDLLNYISHGIAKEEEQAPVEGDDEAEQTEAPNSPPTRKKGALDSFAVNLL